MTRFNNLFYVLQTYFNLLVISLKQLSNMTAGIYCAGLIQWYSTVPGVLLAHYYYIFSDTNSMGA